MQIEIIAPTPITPEQTRVFQNISGTGCMETKSTLCRSGIYYSHNCTTWYDLNLTSVIMKSRT